MKAKAKRFAKYYDQCRLPKWVMVLGIVLLAFGIVAAGVTAIFHDKYSSIFGAWETALTNVWFIAFVALVGVGALISLGYPLLTAIGAGLWALFSKDEQEEIAGQPAPETPVVKEEVPAVEDAAPARKQASSPTIDEASLRSLLDTPFMRQSSSSSDKTNLDRVIDDLKIVRINYKKGAKDNVHFSDKNITEIARILYTNKYLKKAEPSLLR